MTTSLTDRLQEILFRAVVRTVLTHRGEIYSCPGLGPWSSNGGSRINDKVQQLLKKFGDHVPGAAEIVVANLKGGKRVTPKSTPTKENKEESKGPSTPKKRKVTVKDEEDEYVC